MCAKRAIWASVYKGSGMLTEDNLKQVLEAILLAAGKAMTEDQLLDLFLEDEKPAIGILRSALAELEADYEGRGVELVRVASGYRFQAKTEWAPWISRLSEEKTQKYSRALLETLALIAYRQPITRGEIEDIRGVAVSTSILKTLSEDREWVRVVGHKEVPGRPALYATTKSFLDYFGLRKLQDLPNLPEVMNLDLLEADLGAAVLADEAMSAELEISQDETETTIETTDLKVELIDVEI